MCWSRREWREEMARREELRKEVDRLERPVFVADEDVEPEREPEVVLEREPVGAER